MKGSNSAYLRLHLSILLAGCTGLFGRFISLSELPLVFWRVLIAVSVLRLVLPSRHWVGLPPMSALLKIGGCGLLLVVHWVFFYGSIKAANVSVGVVCFAAVSFFTSMFEPLILRRRFSWRELLLSLITVAGIMLIFGFDPRYRHGILLGLVSSVLYSLFSVCSKRTEVSTGESASTMLFYELLSGFFLLALLLMFSAFPGSGVHIVPEGREWWMMLLFGSVFTVAPFLLLLQSLRRISAFTVNLSYNLEPIYSIILASLFFGEAREVGVSFWFGIALIIISVALQTFYGERRKKPSTHPFRQSQ